MIRMGKREREEREKWAKHYSSNHQILIVGDGDFSFSLSLATSFASALNITATSFDSYDKLTKGYKNARFNLEELQKLGATIIHGVDATRMKLHVDLSMRRFDRIVYNFPHAGFHGKEDSLRLIGKHKGLVRRFFHNASGMLRPYGEIHVIHKTSAPFSLWNLEELALQNSLALSETIPFKIRDYPGYNHKRGEGSRIDESFLLGQCSTFKFVLLHASQKPFSLTRQWSHDHGQVQLQGNRYYNLEYNVVNFETVEESQVQLQGHGYYNPGYNIVNFETEEKSQVQLQDQGYYNPGYNIVNFETEEERFIREFRLIFEWYFNHVRDTFGRPDAMINSNVYTGLTTGYGRFRSIASGRHEREFIIFLEEMHRLSMLRIEWLRGLMREMP